jgi:hypothetical protein
MFRDIFDRLARGEITPAEGEELAKDRGGSLNLLPSINALNPLAQDHWLFVTALAWIAWRRAVHVRWLWSPFRERAKAWIKRNEGITRSDGSKTVRRGWVLIPIEPAQPTFGCLLIEARGGSAGHGLPVADIDAAERQLWQALKAGSLEATGVPIGARRRKIEPLEFVDFDLVDDEATGEVVLKCSGATLRDACLNVADVLRLWPVNPHSRSRS